jgi:hypothetical protein
MPNRTVIALISLILLSFLMTACERQKIGEITADPGSYRDKEVSVGGTVIQSFGALNMGIYQIDDGTGNLWVYSDSRGVPNKGAIVGVKGRIVPSITFLGVNYATVLRESDRRVGS